MAKPVIITQLKLALKFFTAIVRDYYEEDIRLFKSISLDLTNMQSSKENNLLIQWNGTPRKKIKYV